MAQPRGGWAGWSQGPAILRVVDGAQVLAMPPGARPSSELQLPLSTVPSPRSARFPSICPVRAGTGRFPVMRPFASWHQPGKRWRGGALRAYPGKSFPCPVYSLCQCPSSSLPWPCWGRSWAPTATKPLSPCSTHSELEGSSSYWHSLPKPLQAFPAVFHSASSSPALTSLLSTSST